MAHIHVGIRPIVHQSVGVLRTAGIQQTREEFIGRIVDSVSISIVRVQCHPTEGALGETDRTAMVRAAAVRWIGGYVRGKSEGSVAVRIEVVITDVGRSVSVPSRRD